MQELPKPADHRNTRLPQSVNEITMSPHSEFENLSFSWFA